MDSVESSVGFDGANIQNNYIGDNEAARVEAVYEFIANECRNAPLSFYNCVLDPNSFSRTVENIYYISMLVHQERVAIYLHDTYQIPFLRVLEPRPLHENVDNRIDGLGVNEESNPVVVSIDMDQWKKLIDAFGIKEAKMKID